MRRVIIFILAFSLFFINLSTFSFATVSGSLSAGQKKIAVYLKPDVTVEYQGIKQIFRDINGNIVFPIIYNGSTYLPVRSISILMNEPIEWDKYSKTIYIGRTLSDPSKSVSITEAAVKFNASAQVGSRSKSQIVNAYLKPDILIMYDFVLQKFKDINENQVYPIIYNGSAYLPIRAISALMNEPIEWNGLTSTALIGDGEDHTEEIVEDEFSIAAGTLKDLFEREEVLYYEATSKTTKLKEAASITDKQAIAAEISENYVNAQGLTIEIKGLDIKGYTAEELLAFEKVKAFAESTEYYVLVLENIAYLAAQDTDYSMLADTFLYFALDSQNKMEEARAAVLEIK